MLGRGDFIDERMFGGKHDVAYAVNGVRSRGEYGKLFAAFGFKIHLAAERFAYPVFLHKFCLFRPVEFVESRKKFLAVICYLKKPLSKIFSYDGSMASFAFALFYLLVCQNGVAGRTPVYGRFLSVGKPVLIKL